MSRASGLAQQARDGFRTAFGAEPDGVWSSPGRVNLIGEHTDYNLGFVLPFAIDRRTQVAIRLRADGLIRVGSSIAAGIAEHDLRQITAESVDGWSAYPFATAWGLGQVGVDLAQATGFEAYFTSDVPLGAGLSSSAAIECALAFGLDELWRAGLGRDALVRATHLGENQIVGAPTGTLDQSASLLCVADAALFIDCRDGSHRPVPLGLDGAELSVLVIDTHVQHAHAEGGYAARRASCERAAAGLGVRSLREVGVADLPRAAELLDEETFRRARHIVTENQRVLDLVGVIAESGPTAIGDLLVASHVSMRDDFEISVPQLDAAVEAAMAAGAIGARMTGGGFGGAAIALVGRATAETVAEAVAKAFAERGYAAPTIFEVQPSEGSRREG
ncbi:MAG: galactokinase [Nocardioides sp.]|uniref:galactokinase n=1 Tax=Nocardioides sp. TaxID=35761 RepID=UPI0039E4441F